jgi:hypothetical protein
VVSIASSSACAACEEEVQRKWLVKEPGGFAVGWETYPANTGLEVRLNS